MIDNFLIQGNSHTICEDYTYYAQDDYFIVADGCSSSPNTDIGARLLTHLFSAELEHNRPLTVDSLDKILKKATEIIHSFKLSSFSLDSTLLCGYIKDKIININLFGDGYLFVKYKDGSNLIIEIEYTDNAPYYLRVNCDELYKKQWLEHFPNNRLKIIEYIQNSISKTMNSNVTNYPSYSFDLDNIEYIGIASDGLASFVNPLGDIKSPKEVIDDILSFKNNKGAFVKRRLKKMIKNYGKDGFHNYDDVSVAVFHNGENNENSI